MATALAVLLLGTAGVGTAWAQREIDERRDLAADGTVTVENVAGSVEITGWDRDEVHLTGELGDDVEELEINSSGDRFSVRVRLEDNFHDDGDTDLYLKVPSAARVSVETVSADVHMGNLEGDGVEANTVSGDVVVSARTQHAELASVSGDIEFDGGTSRLRAESVSGDIFAGGVDGEVEVSTVSGDVEIGAGTVNRGRFESVSGDLELDMSLADGGRLTIESMSGDVTVAVPAGQEGQFGAQSFSGRIRSDFGTVDREDLGPGERLDHTEGRGSATIRVESFSGDISIRQR